MEIFHVGLQGKSKFIYNLYTYMHFLHIYNQKVSYVLYYVNYALVIFSKVSHIRKVTPCIFIRASSKFLSQSNAS